MQAWRYGPLRKDEFFFAIMFDLEVTLSFPMTHTGRKLR